MNLRTAIFLIGIFILALASLPAGAQSADDGGWHFELAPYLWGTGMRGELGALGRTAHVDANFGDLLGHLKMAGAFTFEADNGRWSILSDTSFASVSEDFKPGLPYYNTAEAQSDTFWLDVRGGYRLTQDSAPVRVDLTFGARWMSNKNSLEFRSFLPLPVLRVSEKKDWVNAVTGLRAKIPLNKDWYALLQGDIGAGGSDLFYQGIAGVGYLTKSQKMLFLLSYRYAHDKYQSGGYLYDAGMQGLCLTAGLRW